MEQYLEQLRAQGADPAIEIDPHEVVTAAWTVFKCRYGCAHYGKSRCCPPQAPTWRETREILDCYRRAILFRIHHWGASKMAASLARTLFLDGYYKAIAFGSGPCRLCKTCNPEACNFPGQAIPSMEASGIDVFATARAHGLEIHTLREEGEEHNHFGLLLVE